MPLTSQDASSAKQNVETFSASLVWPPKIPNNLRRFVTTLPLVDNIVHVLLLQVVLHLPRLVIFTELAARLDFTKGHWLTMYRNRFPTEAPPLEMRVMTHERRGGVELADDLPNYSGHSGRFMLKLIAARIAMGFRRPEITLGKTVRWVQ